MSELLKLHLGSGSVSLDGWLNIDLESPKADLRLDIRAPLPFEAESVSHVYAEHVIEHIQREEALRLLRECHRVLGLDGVVRITTPDLVWLVDNYAAAITDGWGDLWQPQTPARMINEGMRYWGHCFIYDRPELARLFHEAGFSDVRFVTWRQSDDLILDGIESRPFNNEIIVEGRVSVPADGRSPDPVLRGSVGRNVSDLLAAQGEELEMLRIRATRLESQVDGSTMLEAMAAVKEESDARARHLLALEKIYGEQCADIERLRSENQALHHAITGLAGLREELARLQADFDAIASEARDRSERIDVLAASLGRHEAYIARIRSSLPGRIFLRFFKPQSAA